MSRNNPRHPAWGMVSLAYQEASGKDTRLFRAPNRVHSQVCLRVTQASMTVADRHGQESRPGPEERIVEVYLTPVQFAELITQPNRGNGVPCTIGWVGATRVGVPPQERDEVHEAAEHAARNGGVAESVNLLTELLAKLEARVAEGKGLGVKELREVVKDLDVARMRSTTDLEWWRKDLARRAEAMRARVATELHATADMIVRNMGLEALRERARAMLPGFSAEASAIDVDATVEPGAREPGP